MVIPRFLLFPFSCKTLITAVLGVNAIVIQVQLAKKQCVTANGKILKQSRDNNHTHFVGDMSPGC